MNSSSQSPRACLLLIIAAVLVVVVAAGDYCADLAARRDLCAPKDVAVGYTVQKCGTLAQPCGIDLKLLRQSPCSKEQQDALPALREMCKCSTQMTDLLAKAPSLVQAGATNAVDRFTGVDAQLFTGD